MSAQEQATFKFNIRMVEWQKCLHGFYYGIRRFYLKEDIYSPEDGWTQLCKKNRLGYFYDRNLSLR